MELRSLQPCDNSVLIRDDSVSLPTSCIRCAKPLAVESASGLCPECIRTVQSPVSTPRDLQVAPALGLSISTFTQPPRVEPESADRTRTHHPAAEPLTATGPRAPAKVPLPAAPAGYEMIRELGIGGMGAVYLVREVAPDRMVAMKFLRSPGSQSAFDRFLVEVRSLAALNHPQIIRVLATDFFRSDPFFTTEYLSNGSLLKRLEASGPFDPTEAARLIATVARAVHAANENGVVHRDLKPSNILVADDGTPRVADFGLAKRIDRDDDLTLTFDALGSPPYMAPEQTGKLKSAEIDARTDVYGLGATLYHLVAGRKPFAGDRAEDVMAQVVNDPPPSLHAIRREVPRELEAIILKAMEKDPARRYACCRELAEDLERFLAGQTPVAPLLTWPRRARQLLRHNRSRIAMVAGLAGAIVAIGLAVYYTTRFERNQAVPDPLGAIRAKLQAGESVSLIGKNGEMDWYRWQVGGGTFGKAAPGDGILFETIDVAQLELLDDPGIDRYTIRAEMQQARSLAAANLPNRRRDEDNVGVYFGHADLSSANPPAHAFFAVWYADFDPAAPPGGPVTDQPASLVRAIQTTDPAGKLLQIHTTFALHIFTPNATRPGDWRTFEIVVTPQQLRANWLGRDGKPRSFKGQDPMVPSEKFARLQEELESLRPQTGVVLPPWSPRMPIGIYARSSAVNVRNLTIIPHPAP
jgi:aminoglycoside phosphotransferase (APT) family kinase protein